MQGMILTPSPTPRMRLRQKVLLLAITPLLLVAIALAWFVQDRGQALARQQRATIQSAYLASKEAELKHYVALAVQAVQPLYDSGRTDAAVRDEAARILARLSYGSDGYFFVYDMQGNNLMHPRQPELVGRNLWALRDADGVPAVQRLIERAREGGGFQRYMWVKPSSGQPAPKLGYVVPLARWGWMMGTGIYLDDVERALAQVDAQQSANIRATMLLIALLAMLSALVVAGGGLLLNVSELRVADAKLKALAQRVVESQEEERARLSRDLHDGISQALVSLKLQIEAGLLRLASDPPQLDVARAGLDKAANQAATVLGEVRRISHDLRPSLLDDLGLAAALDHLAQEATRSGATPVRLRVQGRVDDLPATIATVLFRIAQEALTNIERHAGARNCTLELVREGHSVTLAIQDDGGGFDAGQVARHPQRGIGLRNMSERMEAIGGHLDIASGDQGTTVRAHVNWKAPP